MRDHDVKSRMLLLLIGAVLTLLLPALAGAEGANVELATGSFYGPGDELTISVGASAGDAPVPMDAYMSIVVPGGSWLFAVPGPSGLALVPGNPNDPMSWGKLLDRADLPAGFDTGLQPLLKYTFGQGEPPGMYTVFIALFESGTDNLIAFKMREFEVFARPIFGFDCSRMKAGAYDGTGGCGVSLVNLGISSEGFPIFQNFEGNGNTTFEKPVGPNVLELRFRSVRDDLSIFGERGHECFLECTSSTSFILTCESGAGGKCTETFRKR